ncbi:MAG TPA: HI0074 family nucleotidyltransferase substrate-binding subunit [Candidatus Absconditabacterales bacterium]|nr:HI0074 family nucleotidyltransferase substrate-binding subunit [Candidatus Absconditabacterales bacterium]
MKYDIISLKLHALDKALKTLSDVLDRIEYGVSNNDINYFYDSSIQRFEYTFELFWKTLQEILKYHFQKETGGAKSTIDASFEEGIITNSLIRFDMLELRNKTSHIYDEDQVIELSTLIPGYYKHLLHDFKTLQKNYS